MSVDSSISKCKFNQIGNLFVFVEVNAMYLRVLINNNMEEEMRLTKRNVLEY